MNKSQALQDIFLNQVRKENIPVTIYLMNSVQLRGHVRGFDAFTVLHAPTLRALEAGHLPAVPEVYQTAVRGRARTVVAVDAEPVLEAAE